MTGGRAKGTPLSERCLVGICMLQSSPRRSSPNLAEGRREGYPRLEDSSSLTVSYPYNSPYPVRHLSLQRCKGFLSPHGGVCACAHGVPIEQVPSRSRNVKRRGYVRLNVPAHVGPRS